MSDTLPDTEKSSVSSFMYKYGKYIAGVIVIALILLVLFSGGDDGDESDDDESGPTSTSVSNTLCGGQTCTSGQTCENNSCVDLCGDQLCGSGETCENNSCVDLCGDQLCGSGETCVDGSCVSTDPCDGVNCDTGETCVDGSCVATDPCDGVNCDTGETCVDGSCVAHESSGVDLPLVDLPLVEQIFLCPTPVNGSWIGDTPQIQDTITSSEIQCNSGYILDPNAILDCSSGSFSTDVCIVDPCDGVNCLNGECVAGSCDCGGLYIGDQCEYYCPENYVDEDGICNICGVDDGELQRAGIIKPEQCNPENLNDTYPDGAHLDHGQIFAQCSIPNSQGHLNGECWIPPVNVPYWPMGGQYNTDNYYTGLRTYTMFNEGPSGQCFIRGKVISNFMREGYESNRNEEYSDEEMCKQASQTGVCMVFDGSADEYGIGIDTEKDAGSCEGGIWSGWEGYQNYGGQLVGAPFR